MAASLPSRVGSTAVAWMIGQHQKPTQSWLQRCLQGVRTSFGLPAVHPYATAAWEATEHRHGGTPPPGVPVWWVGGEYGHVALSAGGGYCWSNDIVRRGRIDKVRIGLISERWGYDYKGWSADINGYVVWRPDPEDTKKAEPVVNLKQLVEAAKKDPSKAQGKNTHPDDVRIVERALVKEGLLDDRWASDGAYGTKTRKAYARWQRRCGYAGADADGIPGEKSLAKLGKEHGFKVR